MEEYTFHLRPETSQPSGIADFSKIYNPKDPIIVTYTDVQTRKIERHLVEATKITVSGGDKEVVYTLPQPFADQKSTP